MPNHSDDITELVMLVEYAGERCEAKQVSLGTKADVLSFLEPPPPPHREQDVDESAGKAGWQVHM